MQTTATKIVEKLQKKGYQALWAGGCVRDLLLKKEPVDYDIATNATPDEIEHIFEKTYAIGKHFGVILIEENGHHFEIATFRSDSGYSDGRRPKYVTFSDAKEDALRRDFTINGLFYDPVKAEVLDFVNGQQDLKRGLLRFIGEPEKRIQEDHLRLLRAVRFRNRFKLSYRLAGREAIRKHASLILGVSAERIREELNKIIMHHSRKQAFLDLSRMGLLEKIIPEVIRLKKIPQDKNLHSEGNVWRHTLEVLDHVPLGSNLEVSWAALLHDVGKAKTVKYRDGRIRFLKHQEIGMDLAKKVLKRLKFSRTSMEKILWLIHHHHLFDQFHEMSRSTKLHYFDHPHFSDLMVLHHADLMGSNPIDISTRKKAEEDFYEIKAEYETAYVHRELPSHHKELLSGREIMDILGITAGPEVGRIKRQIREMQLEKKVKTRMEAVKVLKKLKA